jgi:hypothetical protein
MRYRVVLFVLLAAAGAARAEAQFNVPNPPPGEDYHVELGLMWWQPAPELRLRTEALAALSEPEIDFVGEFGLEEDWFREFRAVAKAGRKHKFRFSYVPIRYAAETVIERQITFGGVTYNVGLPANASIEWKLWRYGYEYDFVAGDRGFAGAITEFKHNQISAELETPIGSSFEDVNALIPTLGFIARIYPHRTVSITGEYTGIKLPGWIRDLIVDEDEVIEAEFGDFDIYGTVSISRYFGAQVGYRSVTADYLIDEDSADLKLQGLYFGAMVRF